MDEKIKESPISELYSELAVAPLYIIQLIVCIGWLFYVRKEKGCIILYGNIYSFIIIVNYIVALYFRYFY
jgi:hypothetical protein